MKLRQMLLGIFLASIAGVAIADLEPYKDYDISEGITSVTTIKVDANMIDKYLEGIRETWAKSNDIAKELGHIEGYWIHVSQLENSGDFNVVLGVDYKNAAALQPSEKRYNEFMKRWTEENKKRSDEIVMTYPDIREIVGEYHMRAITFK
ncbi:MAG: hypothetical protein WBM54_09635 [Woeseia sp.]